MKLVQFGLTFAIAFTLVATSAAFAQPRSTLNLRRVDPMLTNLPFGKDVKASLKWVRQHVTKRYAAQMRQATTATERLRVRARINRDVRAVEKSQVAFDGKQGKAWATSVLAGEFRVKTGESMMKFVHKRVEHYLFFFNGKLWKYVRPVKVKAVKAKSFVDRVKGLTRNFGLAPNGTYTPDGKRESVSEAVWTTSMMAMRIVNKRAVYQVDLMVLENPKLAALVERGRSGATTARKGAKVDPDLEQFIDHSGKDD